MIRNRKMRQICSKCEKVFAQGFHEGVYNELQVWSVRYPDSIFANVVYAVIYGRLYNEDFDESCQGCKQMMVFTGERLGLLLAKLGVHIRAKNSS
jgi:hypothetical protein